VLELAAKPATSYHLMVVGQRSFKISFCDSAELQPHPRLAAVDPGFAPFLALDYVPILTIRSPRIVFMSPLMR